MSFASIQSELSPTLPNFTPTKHRNLNLLAACLLTVAITLPAAAQTAGTYTVTNLVSDGSVPATITDANFINPWGVTNSTFWVNTQATGLDYVISPTNFTPFTPPATPAFAFKISIPAATGATTATGAPTGAASTGAATGFLLPAPNSTKATFLFASLDGIITGWNSKLGTTVVPPAPLPVAQVVVNNSAAGAVYTDIALITNTNGSYLLAANFGKAATIEVYDSTFAPAKLAGAFTDPALPAGYVPYSVHAIGSQVFVTYALRSATGAPTVAAGNGLVNIFDTSGNFVSHAVTTGGNLNAPWGVAIAPTTFGVFGGDLFIGNFGDGVINIYDPKTFAYLGQLTDGTGKTITNASLWEIFFGLTAPSSANGGNLNTLYFTAGLDSEKHGLLAAVNTNPTATGAATFGISTSTSALTVSAGSSTTAVVSLVPTNNFSGSANILCSGLPVAATCFFAPATVSVTSGAPATTTVTFNTAKPTASLHPSTLRGAVTAGITAAFLLPFGALLTLSRRRSTSQHRSLRLFGLLGVLIFSAAFFVGCSTTKPIVLPSTPTGTSKVTIQATSGTVTQTTVVNLTVQ
jgi:uncharacterized protein (TIGR03118 family)